MKKAYAFIAFIETASVSFGVMLNEGWQAFYPAWQC